MYISNNDFLINMGLHLTGNEQGDNAWINMLLFLSSNDDIKTKDSNTNEPITFSRNNYHLGFKYDNWSNLDIAYKLRLLKWAGNDYLMSLGHLDNVISFKLIEKSLDNSNNVKGSASSDGFIYLNLEYLENSNGFEALNTILHEAVHFNDRYNSKFILLNYLNYLPPIYNEKQLHEAIFNLPISGKIKNHKTNTLDVITSQMKNDILILKNSLVSMNYFEVNPQLPSSEYLNLLRKFSYLYSPFERRAREISAEQTSAMFEKVYPTKNANVNDMFSLSSSLAEGNTARIIYSEVQYYIKCDLDELINLALVNEFNVLNYDNEEDFICEKDMDKFAGYLEKGWRNYKKLFKEEGKNNEKTDSRDLL